MKNIIFWIKNRKESFIYSIFLFSAFELILKIYHEFAPVEINRFFYSVILFGVILIGLLFYGLLFIRKRYTDSEVVQVIGPLLKIHALHQIILPILLYIGMVGFIFFYPYDIITHVMILLVSIIYWLLFINIQAVYDRNFHLETFTHGIYNLVNIFVFFFIITVNLEFFHYWGARPFVIGGVTVLISFVLLLLTLHRYLQVSSSSILIAFVFSLFIGLFAWFIGGAIFSTYFNIGLYLTILYYLLFSLMCHKAEGSLNFSVFVEYFAVAFLAMVILSSEI